MSEGDKAQGGLEGNQPNLDMIELLNAVMKLLRAALVQDRPQGVAREAVRLYHGSDDPSHKTEATQAAFLSNWPDFVRYCDEIGRDDEPLSNEHLAALYIHHTFNRRRRKDRRDKQLAHEVARATLHGEDGEQMPFDPKDSREKEDFLKNVSEEMALSLESRSPRDRMVLELKYFHGLDPKTIVERVKVALPDVSISQPTISRIVARFEDEMRRRLKEE